jgi:hypothetical protein
MRFFYGINLRIIKDVYDSYIVSLPDELSSSGIGVISKGYEIYI